MDSTKVEAAVHATSNYVGGTEGYPEDAPELIKRYESVSSAAVHKPILHLVPTNPCRVLDVGSGSGRDAAWFAAMGHEVVAVEPTKELRVPAMNLHPSPLIEWVDDSLPHLAKIVNRRELFDFVSISAVWMHLDAEQRITGMPVLASLTRQGGTVVMRIRHGPIPPRRRMFEVSAEETIHLARESSLSVVQNIYEESITELDRSVGVSWTRIAFVKQS
jgi:protein-L-isoaspartate O-methyltransferase